MANYRNIVKEEAVSTLRLPIGVSLKEVERLINEQLEGELYQEQDVGDGAAQGMEVRVEKLGDIKLQVEGQLVSYHVPMRLFAKRDIGITELEADGELAMDFTTEIRIDSAWQFDPLTKVVRHEWIRPPKLKMGFLNLPIRLIADQVLERSKVTVETMIDAQLKENFPLHTYIQDAWLALQQTVLLSEEENIWLRITPQDMSISKLKMEDDSLKSMLSITGYSELIMGQKPDTIDWIPLPPFKLEEFKKNDDRFSINFAASIPYAEAERLARTQVLGERFTQGKRTVTVEDIELYGRNEKLIVNTKLSGSYNGNVYMEGVPYYDKKNNTIEVKDLDFELDTRSFLMRSAGWLFRKGLTKRIKENLRFPLEQNIDEIKQMVNEQMADYPISETIRLRGRVDDLNIKSTYLTPEGIAVVMNSKGDMSVWVQDL